MREFEERPDQKDHRTQMIDEYKALHGDYPPRSVVHQEKSKKKKLKYPVVSILGFFFVLMLVGLPAYLVYQDQKPNKQTSVPAYGDERVYISREQPDEIQEDANYVEDENEAMSEEASEEAGKNTDSLPQNQSKEFIIHEVVAGETLIKIAKQYYNDGMGEQRIREFNGLEADKLYEGQVIKIPLEQSVNLE